ncbi:MAG: hypothetical protein FWE34_03415 [Defluviitaleaceae bacterium]|nr:hypothetical protein [Defluviitaleaceae bacterium]
MSNQFPNQPPYGAPGGMPPHGSPYQPYAPTPPTAGSFIEHLHNQGKSGLFLVGSILFTAGTLLSIFVAFSIFDIFGLLLAALPITALWLIFAASKAPRLPEKTLTALTLFKVHTIIMLVLFSLVALLALIVFIIAFIGVSQMGGIGFGPLFLVFLLTMGIFVCVIVFYYAAILKIINSIRDNINFNTFNPLRGVLPFTIIAMLITGLGLLLSLIGLATIGAMGFAFDMMINEIMWELRWIAPELAQFGILDMLSNLMRDLTLTFLFSIVTYTGTILLVVSLNKLASGAKRR